MFSFWGLCVLLVVVAVRVYGDICDENPCSSPDHICTALSDAGYECVCRDNCVAVGNECLHCDDNLDLPPASACIPNPCERDCQCYESCQHAGGYYCRSESGFLGKNCSVPVPTLRCEPDKMVLSVSESFVHEYDLGLGNSFISVAPSIHHHSRFMCDITKPSNGLYEMSIPLPFSDCNTTSVETDNGVVFTNRMWFNRRLRNAMFDVPVPAAEFRCTYGRVYRVVTSLQPVVGGTTGIVTSKKDISPTISLCKVPTCPGGCPEMFRVSGGAVYTVGELIHVTMALDSGPLSTGVFDMYLSCGYEVGSRRMVDIVSEGCHSNSGLPSMIRSSYSSHTVCISFQTPHTLECSEFYIHAELQSCETNNTEVCPSSPDTRRCRSASRGKRSIVPVTVLGPIIYINGSNGESEVTISGMEDLVEQLDQLQVERPKPDVYSSANITSTTANIALFVIVSIGAAVGFLMFFLYGYSRCNTLCDNK